MEHRTLQLETLSCPTCAAKIQQALKKTHGVDEAQVLFNSSRVKLSFDESVVNDQEISSVIARLGYRVLSIK
jgi:copper chaperone CopZ